MWNDEEVRNGEGQTEEVWRKGAWREEVWNGEGQREEAWREEAWRKEVWREKAWREGVRNGGEAWTEEEWNGEKRQRLRKEVGEVGRQRDTHFPTSSHS